MRNIIIDLQNSDAWKIQLTTAINLISLKDAEEEGAIHSTSDNIKFTPYSHANEVIDELFKLLCSKHQGNLETSLRGSNFGFDLVQLMYYKCHRVIFIRGGSYNDSPHWVKRKKAAINLKNTDDKCFQYAATVALNYDEI